MTGRGNTPGRDRPSGNDSPASHEAAKYRPKMKTQSLADADVTVLYHLIKYSFGDAALDIPGLAERMAPTSTIVGAALIHAIWAEAGERLAARGTCPRSGAAPIADRSRV